MAISMTDRVEQFNCDISEAVRRTAMALKTDRMARLYITFASRSRWKSVSAT